MKFRIVYDNNEDILRVRIGKGVITRKEGYGLSELLSKNENFKEVRVSSTNGSIYIKYDGDKQEIIRALLSIKSSDLYEMEAKQDEIIRETNNKYINRIIRKVAFKYLSSFLLPQPINAIKIMYDSLPYLKKGFNSLINMRIDVDLLDATSLAVTLGKRMFSTAGSISFLIGISEILEEYTIEKTKHSLESSLMININKVWIESDEGIEKQISFNDLKEKDHVIIRSGTMIPADGVIVDGEAEINQAAMTGESLAIRKTEGNTVFTGTIVENGRIVVEVTALNENTRINQIIKLIESSEEIKAGIQSKAEKLADSIVPWNFAITILTYLITGNTTKAIAALTVDYSCAIKLTTPLSVISTMREASEREIVVKGGRYLESFATADTIIFDKTGTLTKSTPHVAKYISLGVLSDEEVLRQAACIEEHFPHSVATAIVSKAKELKLRHDEELHSEVEYIVAHGIVTSLCGKRTVLGSRQFVIEDEKVKISEEAEKIIQENIDNYSVIYLGINGNLEGIICIDDPPRDEAKEVLSRLKELEIKEIIMLTGDSENAAKTTAELLNIDTYKSQVLPEEKSEVVEKIKSQGKKVIMVGDGINDSPALSAADVSVAMKDSSDLAREVADITLLRPALDDLVTLRLLSQRMLEVINDNYSKIILFNTTFMGLGLAGVITPSLTSILHNGTTMLLSLKSTSASNFKQIE